MFSPLTQTKLRATEEHAHYLPINECTFSTGLLQSTTVEEGVSDDAAGEKAEGAHMSPGAVPVSPSAPEGRRSSLDRLMDILAAEETKKVCMSQCSTLHCTVLNYFMVSF